MNVSRFASALLLTLAASACSNAAPEDQAVGRHASRVEVEWGDDDWGNNSGGYDAPETSGDTVGTPVLHVTLPRVVIEAPSASYPPAFVGPDNAPVEGDLSSPVFNPWDTFQTMDMYRPELQGCPNCGDGFTPRTFRVGERRYIIARGSAASALGAILNDRMDVAVRAARVALVAIGNALVTDDLSSGDRRELTKIGGMMQELISTGGVTIPVHSPWVAPYIGGQDALLVIRSGEGILYTPSGQEASSFRLTEFGLNEALATHLADPN